MNTSTLHPLAADYLRRLDRAARHLPRARRYELMAEIEAHLLETISTGATDAEALTELDRLGDPEEIVEAEQPAPVAVATARGAHEWAAIVLLLIGGFLFGIGWFVGVLLLWTSAAWTVREKLIGTLIVPGGWALLAPVTLLVSSTEVCSSGVGRLTVCTGGPSTSHAILGWVLLVALVLGPLATAVFLARRAQRRRRYA